MWSIACDKDGAFRVMEQGGGAQLRVGDGHDMRKSCFGRGFRRSSGGSGGHGDRAVDIASRASSVTAPARTALPNAGLSARRLVGGGGGEHFTPPQRSSRSVPSRQGRERRTHSAPKNRASGISIHRNSICSGIGILRWRRFLNHKAIDQRE